jgi:hypothetical protein
MSRRWLAFGLSCFVYLLPLPGPHAVWLVGDILVQDWSSAAEEKSLAWRAADLGLAVSLQAIPTVFFEGGLFGYSDTTGMRVIRLPKSAAISLAPGPRVTG